VCKAGARDDVMQGVSHSVTADLSPPTPHYVVVLFDRVVAWGDSLYPSIQRPHHCCSPSHVSPLSFKRLECFSVFSLFFNRSNEYYSILA